MRPQLDEGLLDRLDYLISKAEALLVRNRDRSGRSKSVKKPEIDADHGAFTEWQMQTVNFLVAMLGRDSIYTRGFASEATTMSDESIQGGLGILRAVKEDIKGGYLTDLRTLISAEVFTDFLKMAGHLYEAGYKDPAASLAGAVLEDGLRKIASVNEIKLKAREDLSSLNRKVADKNVNNRLVQKKVQVWTGVRNHADHGEFGEYSSQNVADMIRGIEKFLADYLQ